MSALSQRETNAAVLAATLASGTMIGFQMAGKATRDALFLSSFDISALPGMVIAAAFLSLGLATLAARMMTVWGPRILVPSAFLLSAFLLGIEWMLIESARRPIAVVVYLHFTGLGALLVSGFWSIINERFDPRTAKKRIGRIAAGGTVGALIGGILAERVAATLSINAMLPILALLHLASAAFVYRVHPPRQDAVSRNPSQDVTPDRSGLRLLASSPYLRTLVALVVLGTVSEGLIDFVFKARASAAFDEESLLRFFAAFYTGTSLLTIVVQAVATRRFLQNLGLAKTVATLPAAVVVGGSGALLFPGLGGILFARGIESITRNSLYRSAYELLFGPVDPREKRSTKALIDVGVVRMGDALGGGTIQATLMVASRQAWGFLLALGVVLGAIALWITRRVQRGYLRSLERSLLARADHLDLDEMEGMTRTAMLHTAGGIDLTQFRATVSAELPYLGGNQTVAPEQAPAETSPAEAARDPDMDRIQDLRSGDLRRVRQALTMAPIRPMHAPFVIPLLGWDLVARDAIAALRSVAPRITGLLIDALLDQDEAFAVRRRVPVILVGCPSQRAVDGLLAALDDQRFEVRYRAGRALHRIRSLAPSLRINREQVIGAIDQELAVDRGVWEGRRLLDELEDDEWSPVLDEVLRDRANRSLEHVFTMLALLFPPQPLKVAFQGLHTDDAMLRGTALEYLETALPEELWTKLRPVLEGSRPHRVSSRDSGEVLADLLKSQQSIVIQLESLKQAALSGERPAKPPPDTQDPPPD